MAKMSKYQCHNIHIQISYDIYMRSPNTNEQNISVAQHCFNNGRQQNPSSFFAPLPCRFSLPWPSASRFKLLANLGKRAMLFSGDGDAEIKRGGKKTFITKEEEPEQYWQTAGEREEENPMMTPLPCIIIFGMSTPFVILAIAFANGWVKVPVR
ncbi:uncharacterized protein LOC111484012 [Cucurbita maxima]|uniref:Uncharacterized protein LOC111484012 n=1 Tax=Cucurbita maxima TaxID=3661 RepID=A0A6J1J6X3_CUCMA|nr:uncharacterized protein LOC111484012 [Cucurbita maxima]